MATARPERRRQRRSYHHGDLRRALLDEALAIIREEGVEGVTLRGIGARAGVSRSALYRHFADKDALLTAVATEGFRRLRERLVEAWQENGGGPGGWRAMGVAYIRFAVANPSHYRVIFGRYVASGSEDEDLATEAHGAFQALVDAVFALQEEGFLHRDDPVLLARFIWAVVHGIAMLAIDGQVPEAGAVDELMSYSLERLQTGIRAG